MKSGQSPVKTEATFEIPFPVAEVWPVLSKTDWLNRSAGLPPVSYEVAPLPEGGVRVFAKARFYGIRFQWEEKPFEWREPEFYRVERCFAAGPIHRIVGGMDFRESDGKTRMRTFCEIYPASKLGSSLARLVLAPQATSGMGAIADHVTGFLRGRERAHFPNLTRTALNESAMSAAAGRLRESDPTPRGRELSARLEELVREAPDVELTRIRPFMLAKKWNEDRWEVLRIFLLATRAGLLDLSWEVLCPNCRTTRAPRANELSHLKNTAHCEVCQIKFDAEFDKSVELKFTVNPAIKICDESTFCLAGPGSKPHVIAQRIVGPKGSAELPVPGHLAGVRIRSPQIADVVQGRALKDRLICHKEGFAVESREESWGGKLEIYNPNSFPVLLQLERSEWSEDILTAACVTNLQEFRDLFSHQVVSPAEQVVVGQQVILFTDLRGSTAMYCGIGDAPAYALVRDHFAVLRRVIQEHRGAIVKTIGDAVMAVFTDPRDALQAVRKMHLELGQVFAQPGGPLLKLKSGLHLGPCLAVNANERLDYFGTTVNLAARLVDCCQGGDLVLSNEFYRRNETESFLRANNLGADPAEMQFRGFTAPNRVWRIPFLPEAKG